MSHRATTWAWQQELPALQKLVLLALADRHNNDTERCDPSMGRVASDCGMSRDSVRRSVKELEDKGLISAIERKEGPVNLTNSYKLNIVKTEGVGANSTGGRCSQHPGVGANSTPNLEVEPVIEPGNLLVIPIVLPEWLPIEEWEAFLENRRAIKKPVKTEYGKKCLLSDLEKLHKAGNDIAAVLRQSISRNYTGVFAVKENGNGYTPPPKQQKEYVCTNCHNFEGSRAEVLEHVMTCKKSKVANG